MLATIIAAGLLFAGQGGAERISSYDIEMVVEDDGDLVVIEQIEYDFGGEQRRGIFRDIPTREPFDDEHDRLYPLTIRSVQTSPGAPDDYTREQVNGTTRIRIGDPDVFITGQHTYTIVYEVDGALNAFPDHVELYWDPIGHSWGVPIDQASVRVVTPAPVTRVGCFAGPPGSSLRCDRAVADTGGAVFGHDDLQPGEGLTVVVALPPGSVPPAATEPILEERWTFDRAFSRTAGTLSASGLLLLLVLGLVVRHAWRTGRDRRAVGSPTDVAFGDTTGGTEPVPLSLRTEHPVEFAPPDGIRPGQIGVLVDERAHPLDVTATIVDLAVRGFLRIEEIPKEGWFGKPDWRLVRLDKPAAALLPYESLLLSSLFEDHADGVVELSKLKTKFVERLGNVQEAMYDDAVGRGWFRAHPNDARRNGVAAGLGLVVVGAVLVWALARWTRLGLVPVPVVLGGLALLAMSPWLAARTAKGTGVLKRSLGFRRFIEDSEAERARFAEEKHLFTEYLPYAVVFGATDSWAERFAGLDDALPDQSSWYVGVHPFTTLHFASAMDGFSTVTSGTIAASPSGSGVSGGSGFSGGFSGGGGGGGGGGSW